MGLKKEAWCLVTSGRASRPGQVWDMDWVKVGGGCASAALHYREHQPAWMARLWKVGVLTSS